ncbi:MAG: hypothetical protein J0I41_09775 [Filimonas sp.]|nr:hypothetical protein [Filimonas sp.]
MSINLVEAIQKELGYAPLQKINPNETHSSIAFTDQSVRLAQAAIPATLAGLYKLSRTPEGCEKILSGNFYSDKVNKTFGAEAEEMVLHIATFASVSKEKAHTTCEAIAACGIKIMQHNLKPLPSVNNVRDFFTAQRNNILPYLVPELKTGNVIHDNTIDDSTNKMKGPVSNFMHMIERFFSDSDESITPKK